MQYVRQISQTEKMTFSIDFQKRLEQERGKVCHGRLSRTEGLKFDICLCLRTFYNVK